MRFNYINLSNEIKRPFILRITKNVCKVMDMTNMLVVNLNGLIYALELVGNFSMVDHWYVANNGKSHGPFTLAQLLNGLKDGKIASDTLVWKQGMLEWLPARNIADLQPAQMPPPIPLEVPKSSNIDYESTSARSAKISSPQRANLDHEMTMSGTNSGKQIRKAKGIDFESTTVGGNSLKKEEISRTTRLPEQTSNQSITDANGQLVIGSRLGKYIVGPVLGKGGMGIAYRVTDSETETDYAIKILARHLASNPNAINDLKKEVALAKQISHTNLLKVNEFGSIMMTGHGQQETNRIYFLEMELVDGENLEEYRLKHGGKIGLEEFTKIFPQILLALDHLHDKGMIHSDIKLQNIMISRKGEIKIMDYGVAKTIKEQMLWEGENDIPEGTLAYMAPEQIRRKICDRRADIYSLGIAMYKLISGTLPFNVESRKDIIAWHFDTRHELNPKLPEPVHSVIKKITSVNPDNRFISCREILEDHEVIGLLNNKGAIPPLPQKSLDNDYLEYKSVFDPDKTNAPVPKHPDTIVDECKRLWGMNCGAGQPNPGLLKWMGARTRMDIARDRFKLCLSELEKWAYYYPKYRADYINLWNMIAQFNKEPLIDGTFFKQQGIIGKYEV